MTTMTMWGGTSKKDIGIQDIFESPLGLDFALKPCQFLFFLISNIRPNRFH